MKPVDHSKVIGIFNDALELPSDERARFLSGACGDDAELRAEVDSLLASYDETFLEADASENVLDLICGRLLPGDVVCDRYQIIEMIARGGMGEVYLAKDPSTNRRVALKTLPENFSQDKRRMENFRKEAQTVSKMNHPNILTVYDFNEEANFIVTEYIEGETLRSKLKSGALNVPKSVAIARQIALALEAAHTRGIVHSDIKPENVVVRGDGLVKVLDFGIAKLAEREVTEYEPNPTRLTQVERASGFGTVSYMSPEQLRPQEVDARTDIWSLGVCLSEMLTGLPPFKGDFPIDIAASILNKEPEPLGQHVPEGLKAIVKRALNKNRNKRYQTMREFAADLEISSTVSNREADTFKEWGKTSGAKIWKILLACAATSCVLAAVVALIILAPDPSNSVMHAAQGAQAVGSIFHLIAIFIAYLYLRKNPGPQEFRPLKYDKAERRLRSHITYATGYEKLSDWKRAREIAKEALKYYRDAFVWLLFAWLFLYGCVLVSLGDYGDRDFIIASVLTLANNFNTLCIWLCFAILDEPITTEDRSQNRKGIIVKEGRKWPAGFIATIVLMLIWFIAELWFTSFTSKSQIHFGSRVISGIAGGGAMALFVGRFTSKFLKSPTWLVFTLFLYTVIQALFIFFGEESSPEKAVSAAVVINAALVLKCLLILYIFWLLQSGRLLFYLVRVRRATTQVDSEWQNFREVLQQESHDHADKNPA